MGFPRADGELTAARVAVSFVYRIPRGTIMNPKTVAQATTDLQKLAKQCGASRFDVARKSYFEQNYVTDEAGAVLSPDEYTIDVQVEPAVSKAADAGGDIAKSIRDAVRAELADRGGVSITKASSIRVGDDLPGGNVPRGRVKYLRDPAVAHAFGRWLQASTFGNNAPQAVKFCREKGLALRFGDWKDDNSDVFVEKAIHGHSESVNADGGFLVPEQFDNEITWLREQYGVFRRFAKIKMMSSDRLVFHKKTSSHTAYFVGEGGTNTASKMGFADVGLTARKARVDGFLTMELSDDAAVRLGDEAANDCAEAFALLEDNCGFNGDGTAAYGGITGLVNAFINLGTFANTAGLYDCAGSSWAGLTLPMVQSWRAKLPAHVRSEDARIFCSKAFYNEALERLSAQQGGATLVDMATGLATPMFLGTPVVFTQALASSATADVPDAFYGDLAKACTFGDRQGFTFRTTDTGGGAWETDEIAYKATQRFDIVCHDIGNNSATASLRKAGGVVALIVA